MATDPALEKVFGYLSSRPLLKERAGTAIRQAIDEVLDGGRTGRWDIHQLSKTEKTYIGTKVEIILKAQLGFPQGRKLDSLIEGFEVDVKFSINAHGYMIPAEAVGQLCILVWADDALSRFSLGLVRAEEAILNPGRNRDGKRTIRAASRNHIRWLITEAQGELPRNFLLNLKASIRDQILRQPKGQPRVTELFRAVQKQIIPREAIVILGQQQDPLKRVRDTRQQLLKEGIAVLGHHNEDRLQAISLGLIPPKSGEFISASLAGRGTAVLTKS
jgi:hypothetical protein